MASASSKAKKLEVHFYSFLLWNIPVGRKKTSIDEHSYQRTCFFLLINIQKNSKNKQSKQERILNLSNPIETHNYYIHGKFNTLVETWHLFFVNIFAFLLFFPPQMSFSLHIQPGYQTVYKVEQIVREKNKENKKRQGLSPLFPSDERERESESASFGEPVSMFQRSSTKRTNRRKHWMQGWKEKQKKLL